MRPDRILCVGFLKRRYMLVRVPARAWLLFRRGFRSWIPFIPREG